MTRSIVALVAILSAGPSLCAAQTLADVARAEEARRKAVQKTGRVYTNDSLRPEPAPAARPSTPSSAPAAPEAPAAAAPATGEPPAPGAPPAAPAAAGPARDQVYWSSRIKAARAEADRSRTLAEALQSRINALTADFVNRDDPAQRAVIEQDRLKALAELDRLKKDMETQAKAIAAIEEEARRAGVPPGWLR